MKMSTGSFSCKRLQGAQQAGQAGQAQQRPHGAFESRLPNVEHTVQSQRQHTRSTHSSLKSDLPTARFRQQLTGGAKLASTHLPRALRSPSKNCSNTLAGLVRRR